MAAAGPNYRPLVTAFFHLTPFRLAVIKVTATPYCLDTCSKQTQLNAPRERLWLMANFVRENESFVLRGTCGENGKQLDEQLGASKMK